MDELSREYRVMHWTDIHLGHFRGRGFLDKLVEMTNAAGVEAVLITGDLFDGKIRFGDHSLDALKHLDAPAYFVAGNHDGYSGVEAVKAGLRNAGVHVLSNQVAELGEIQLIGLNHMPGRAQSGDIRTVDGLTLFRSVLDSLAVDPDTPSLLLHHSPDGVELASKHGVDLYLSGHTHGGQLFPITWIGELIYRYNKGLYDFNGTRVFVGEGAGTFGPPMRLGTHSSITRILLKPSNNPSL
jgi:predicted MPP superfamily phosphohydrolase